MHKLYVYMLMHAPNHLLPRLHTPASWQETSHVTCVTCFLNGTWRLSLMVISNIGCLSAKHGPFETPNMKCHHMGPKNERPKY